MRHEPKPSTGMLGEALRQILPYSHLGWQLLGTVLLFLLIGWGLDKLLGISPYGIIFLSVCGIVVGLYTVLKTAETLSGRR